MNLYIARLDVPSRGKPTDVTLFVANSDDQARVIAGDMLHDARRGGSAAERVSVYLAAATMPRLALVEVQRVPIPVDRLPAIDGLDFLAV